MSANLQVLLDSIDQGLLIVSPDGVVRLLNSAANQLLPSQPGKRLCAEEIRVQINAAARGYVRLPMELEIEVPGSGGDDHLQVKLMDSPVGGGYLILVRNISAQARCENLVTNFANLLDVELRQPMLGFAQALNGLLAELVPDLDVREALSERMRLTLRQGEMLAGRVDQLAAFAQVFAKSPLLANDRVPVLDLVGALLLRVRPLLEKRNIKLDVSRVSGDLPVVYGSRGWLVEALYGYVEHLVLECRVKSDLELAARPYGNFIELQIRNHGRSVNRQADGKNVLPFAAAMAGKNAPHTLGLGLPLCRHVVELHRGHLKLTEEDGEITALILELPTGAPPDSDASDQDSQQVRRYAEDLSRLMQRQRQARVH